MASKRSRASTLGLLLVGALALSLSACTSTMKDCATGFALVSPKDGATYNFGENVPVQLTALSATFCTFAPKVYEVSVDGGAPISIAGTEATPATVLKNLTAGEHTVTAVAKDTKGKVLAQCAAKFKVLPPTAAPPPTPVVAPPPPPAAGMDLVAEAGRYLKDVFFDFDKSDIRADQKANVDEDAKWLREHTTVGITVEGHCDERGTREYNLALGERRANAVRDALVALGVDPAQIKTISYGKERPFCTEHPKEMAAKEACWQQNRRGHFVPALR